MQNIFKIIAAETTKSIKPGTNTDTPSLDTVGDNEDHLLQNVTNIINGVIAALGVVCVVVMIIGGINYMTSAGDTNKVTKARNTVLYGLIGLVICVLAFAIVNFVIMNVIGGKTS